MVSPTQHIRPLFDAGHLGEVFHIFDFGELAVEAGISARVGRLCSDTAFRLFR